jgi:hypothetical protein
MKQILRVSFFLLALSPFLVAGGNAAETRSTDQRDQTALEVTVYNTNMGLVKDVRRISLGKGGQELRFMDVATGVIPASVSIKSISAPNALSILEQNYEYDLLNPSKLLDKYVGREVKLLTRNAYTDKEEVVTATVLSNNQGSPVFKINNEITFNHPGRIIFPQLPENLIPKPTLVWLLDSKTAGTQNIEALYLTNNINWRADYVLLLNDKDTKADLSGWVTIDNKSGADYKDAKLKLVAGDVQRILDQPARATYKLPQPIAAKAAGGPQFKEETFFEYHIYGLQRRTTLKQNQTKQISFLETQNVPVKKEFLFKGARHYYQSRYPDPVSNEKVSVYVEMINKKENNLGMPIPKGIMRVYKADSDGSLQFIGEDQVDHTAKDEKIRARLGFAFDIAAKRKQMQWEKISKDIYEVAFEISLRNHKKEDITVQVMEPLPGDWKVLESSHPYKKEDAFTVAFEVPVKKDGETKLTYKVRVRF